MLRYTGIKIELFTDMSMHDFIEQAKRDGIAMACRRFYKANNQLCINFNPRNHSTFLPVIINGSTVTLSLKTQKIIKEF